MPTYKHLMIQLAKRQIPRGPLNNFMNAGVKEKSPEEVIFAFDTNE